MRDPLDEAALRYHRASPAGKLAVVPTKPMETQRDLALAYSPGVAAACLEIEAMPGEAATLTGRSNLVAVITNGTAVLGLGNIGPLASKPVMEGKAALFKKFSGIDVFDLEVDATTPEELIEVVARLEPTFGGINLEDIKAPECFQVEAELRKRMKIPVFHDDQHGTAIIVATAVQNALKLVGKQIGDVQIVTSGAGAAGIACLNLLVSLGAKPKNILLCDSTGVIHTGRNQLDGGKRQYARDTTLRSLGEAVDGADVFLGLSAPGVLTKEMVRTMANAPLILALANPNPEILPEDARAARSDAIIATGRSDYPNQVNNVLCFPFIFRGALDVGATEINEAMKIACVEALARVAQAETSDVVAQAYQGEPLTFGPDYIIPKPFDPRLILEIAPAVAKAAMDTGVATRPIEDFASYRAELSKFVFRSGALMQPLFERAAMHRRRVVFAEGEERRVLQAVQQVVDQRIAKPILIGRPEVIERRIEELGLRISLGVDVELVNPHHDDRYRTYWTAYHEQVGRLGVSPEAARMEVRSNHTVIAALMLRLGEADAMLCGTDGRFRQHLQSVSDLVGLAPGVKGFSTLIAHTLDSGTLFLCDTHVTDDPDAAQLADMTLLAAEEVKRFGLEPRVALLSRSNFGTHHSPGAQKMRDALALIRARAPALEIDGEMNADAALLASVRELALPNSTLTGRANLLVMPNVEAANIASNLVDVLGSGVSVGPILIGCAKAAHVVTQSISVRGLVNMCAIAVNQVQADAL
ncbi:MAG: malate dehydrogenase (oxaloacetate-decarboxylating)(NADP+) [Gammaproteobacteria bacterium]|jgi:malate dehydrogenase (oxaloacetate-decarboxylating)(NADP+)